MRDRRSLLNFVRALFFVCIPVCLCFVVEKLTGRNLFSVFGGVPEFTAVRDGKLRVQGAFAHPILAGTWWAVCMPLFLSYGFLEGAGRLRRLVPVAGGVCSFLIVLMTASSTPIAAMIVGVLAFGIFRWRAQVWGIRWWAVLGLAIVHMLVESGIHGLVLTKVSFVSGSTGYHRYLLIDSAIRNVSEWFFVGVNETWHWGWGLDDVTCQYVKAAVDGGVIAFVILLLIVAKSVAIPVNFSFRSAMASECRLSWGVASAMAANATALVTVTYFGQITILLAILLAVSLNIDVFRRPRISEEKYVTAKFAVPVVGLKAAEGSAQSHELARFFSRRPPMQG